MKIYKLPVLAESSSEGVYFLGPEDIKSQAVYLLYGRLRPKETGRAATPKDGCEEIVYLVKGSMRVRCGKSSFSVSAGEAFHYGGTYYLDNPGEEEAVYIAAGGGNANRRMKESPAEASAPHPAQAQETPGDYAAAKEPADNDFIITRDDAGEGEQ